MNEQVSMKKGEKLPGNERHTKTEGNGHRANKIRPGTTERIQKLRKLSVEAEHTLSIERALIETEFYKKNYGKHSIPVLRALTFLEICKRKTLYLGDDELIVGERGPCPKAVPTFPELTCHSVEDFRVLNTREKQRYTISEEDIEIYAKEVIPYWKGKTQRERIFDHVPSEWKAAYEAGLFTEFMEQRAPGHTCLDGQIYNKGMLDFKKEIAEQIEKLDYLNDPEATDRAEQLQAMDISCDAAIVFAARHADLADELAEKKKMKSELLNLNALQKCVVGYLPTRPVTSGRPFKCIGLFTWEPSRN